MIPYCFAHCARALQLSYLPSPSPRGKLDRGPCGDVQYCFRPAVARGIQYGPSKYAKQLSSTPSMGAVQPCDRLVLQKELPPDLDTWTNCVAGRNRTERW